MGDLLRGLSKHCLPLPRIPLPQATTPPACLLFMPRTKPSKTVIAKRKLGHQMSAASKSEKTLITHLLAPLWKQKFKFYTHL